MTAPAPQAKLVQLLAYLDREGVTEIVLGVGRPLTVGAGANVQVLSHTPLSHGQLDRLFEGTPIQLLISGDSARATELELGGRRVRAEVMPGEDTASVRLVAAGPAKPRTPVKVVASDAMPKKPKPSATPGNGVPIATREPVIAMRTPPRAAPVAVDDAPSAPIAVRDAPSQPVTLPLESAAPTLFDERSDVSRIAPLVRAARQRGGSDLHVASGRAVMVRIKRELVALDADAPALGAAAVEAMLLPLLGPGRQRRLQTHGYVDLAIDVPGAGRLRANISRQRDGLHAALRLGPAQPQSLDELGLPSQLAKVVQHHQGLVVIAGPSGHGKTTTLAALVDLLNASKPCHIITIEDPVEVLHPRKRAVMSQREVGSHTQSFVSALKASLREDPDVIVIGELRDRESVEIALTAAETGHLVLATMSTPSAAKTIDRLIDLFPPTDQPQVRASLAGALRAVIAQCLLPTATGDGMVPAIELVTGVLPLGVLIRDDKLYQLPNLMQRGAALGMIRIEESLERMLGAGTISEDAIRELAGTRRDLGVIVPKPPAPEPKRGLFGRKGRD
ncbi:MAG TPA: PilT/PilU family type 4a pilus ATPase [Kofleriaceae bacterium]|nr:PilT/PilU family type 4a pilus ATPase [Kofleriaceae bacterium]